MNAPTAHTKVCSNFSNRLPTARPRPSDLNTAATGAHAGTVLFVFGQIALVLFVERIRFQARINEEVAEGLVRYASEYSTLFNPWWGKTMGWMGKSGSLSQGR